MTWKWLCKVIGHDWSGWLYVKEGVAHYCRRCDLVEMED